MIVGAGLAGLAAARTLATHGTDFVVLEASDEVGGRVRTDVVDGFTLDRGFQLYNPSYPEGRRVFDYDQLDLQPFFAGAILAKEDSRRWVADPRRSGKSALRYLRSPLGPLETVRLVRYLTGCAVIDPQDLAQRPDISIADALGEAGLGGRAMDLLLRPFLSGVLGEKELASSRRFADVVLRSLVRGTPTVPATGMRALPDQLAKPMRGHIYRNLPVNAVTATEVHTDSGTIAASAVIVATDPMTAHRLVPSLPQPTMNALTTWYFAAPSDQELTKGHAVLTVESGGRGPLTNTVVMTNAAALYAPPGNHLIQATAVGESESEAAVASHLALLYGVDTGDWEMIARYPIAEALPNCAPPFHPQRKQDFDGILVAGDHRDTASIQGALVSGRRAGRRAHGRT